MQQIPQAAQDQDAPQSYGWCMWHRGFTHGLRMVGAVEQASGPGAALFACGPCRETNGLVPLADQ